MRINRIPFFYGQIICPMGVFRADIQFIIDFSDIALKLEHSFLFLSGCRCRGGNLHFNIKTDFNVGTFMVSMFFNCIYKPPVEIS